MGIEQLGTFRWLVKLDEEAAEAYAAMRMAEARWLADCERAGCRLVRRDDEHRQVLVLATPGVEPPGWPGGGYIEHAEWRAAAVRLAEAQRKEPSVGVRSAQPPAWIEQCALVDRVTWRLGRAARGAQISAAEALGLLAERRSRLEGAIQRSLAAGQKSRAEGQRAALAAALVDEAATRAAIDAATARGGRIGVQVLSGQSWSLGLHFEDGKSSQVTIPTILLARATRGCLILEAAKRHRPMPPGQEVFEIGMLRLTVSYL